jgi:hypothetical protein
MGRYRKMGVTDFAIGTDVAIMYDWLKENGNIAKSVLGRSDTRSGRRRS